MEKGKASVAAVTCQRLAERTRHGFYMFGRLPKICRTNFHFYEREANIKAKHFGHLSYGSNGTRCEAISVGPLGPLGPMPIMAYNKRRRRVQGGSRVNNTYIGSDEWCLPLQQHGKRVQHSATVQHGARVQQHQEHH